MRGKKRQERLFERGIVLKILFLRGPPHPLSKPVQRPIPTCGSYRAQTPSRNRMASVPFGQAARATRAVSSGTLPKSWGYIDLTFLLLPTLVGSLFPPIVPFHCSSHSPTES